MRWSKAAVILALFVLPLAGCARGGAEDNPARTAENFLHSLGRQDVEAMCQMLSDDGQPVTKDYHWEKCQSGMHTILGLAGAQDLGKYQNASVTKATIEANEAKVSGADIQGVVEPDVSLTLTRIDQKWYVSDFD